MAECHQQKPGGGSGYNRGKGYIKMFHIADSRPMLWSIALLSVLASGCTGTRYMPAQGQLAGPATAPQALQGFAGTADIQLDLPGGYASPEARNYPTQLATSEVSRWFADAGEDLTVSMHNENIDDSGWITMIPYFLTLGILPSWVTTKGETVMEVKAGDQVLFQNREPVQYKSALSMLLPTAYLVGSPGTEQYEIMTNDQLNRHKQALQQFIQSQQAGYESAVSAGTVDAYRQYLNNNPESFFRMETLRRLAELAPATHALPYHRDNIAIDSAYIVYLPDEYDIWFLGPQDLKVYDVLRLSRDEDNTLLASRIRATRQPYKIFNTDEIALLKEGGLSSDLIAAMIDASASSQTGPTPAPPAVASAAAQPAGTPAESPAQNGMSDIAAQCAKRYAAFKACDQVPSFGANICRSQVKKKYSHIACELIQ